MGNKNKRPKNVIVENSSSWVTEDEFDWITTIENGVVKRDPKATAWQYPIACVVKWGFKIADKNRYDEILKEYPKWEKREKAEGELPKKALNMYRA